MQIPKGLDDGVRYLGYLIYRLFHRPVFYNYRTHRFGNLIYFRPQVRRETPNLLGPLERNDLSHWMETDPVSEMSCFIFSRIPDDGQSPKNPVILSTKICLFFDVPTPRVDVQFVTVRQHWDETCNSAVNVNSKGQNLWNKLFRRSLLPKQKFLCISYLWFCVCATYRVRGFCQLRKECFFPFAPTLGSFLPLGA
jgi:hypothetical protein